MYIHQKAKNKINYLQVRLCSPAYGFCVVIRLEHR